MAYKVTYAIDSLDPNPMIETFESEWEALEFVSDEMQRRVQHVVAHSAHALSESDLREIEEIESTLVLIERI